MEIRACPNCGVVGYHKADGWFCPRCYWCYDNGAVFLGYFYSHTDENGIERPVNYFPLATEPHKVRICKIFK